MKADVQLSKKQLNLKTIKMMQNYNISRAFVVHEKETLRCRSNDAIAYISNTPNITHALQ